jgi:hypothetical protein
MARSTVVCQGKHTALYEKDDVRSQWMWETPRHKDIITISHGALSALNTLRWKGNVYMCDIDPGVIESATYLWQDGTFPHIKLHKPLLCEVQTLTALYADKNPGTTKLGAVDADLANCMEGCIPVVQTIIRYLQEYRIHTKVLLTFRNGRRCKFGCINGRIQALKDSLPRGSRYVKHRAYTSMAIREDASRYKGSSMCLVELAT